MSDPIVWLLRGDSTSARGADGNADHTAVNALPDGDALEPETHRCFGS